VLGRHLHFLQSSKKYRSIMSLEAPLCPFLCRAVCVNIGAPICHRWTFFFSLLSPKKCRLTLFVTGISTSIILLLILNFFYCLFYRSFICFHFRHSIAICYILFFFNLVLILLISSFFFFAPFLKV
jgi:hypothetical protein